MSKLSFMTDMKFFATKPKGKDVMEFQNNNVSTQMELCELASSLANGMTFKPAVLSGKSSDTWLSQQLFALDFDGAATFDEVEALFSFAKPAFGYTTYSHTEEKHRFRLVFVLEHPVTDVRLRNMIQHSLMTIYKMCDKKAKDPTRLFFGGTRLIFEDYQSRICPHDVMVHAICRDETNYTKNMKSFCKKLELKVDDGRPSVELIESQESNDSEAVVYRSNNKIFRFNFVSQKQGKQVILKKKKNKVILKKKKDDSAKINNFDFDELYEKCQLYQDVIDGSHWAYHDELFGLACNLVQVSGGEKRLRQVINELDCYEDKRKSFNNMISYIKKTKYSPMRCENFCPHFKNNCSNKGLNMFSVLKNKERAIRKISDYAPENSLSELGELLENKIKEVFDKNDNSITIIKAPTSAGKTEALKSLDIQDSIIIAYPTHRLGDETVARLEIEGAIHAKELKISCNATKRIYESILSLGDYKGARGTIERYLKKLEENNGCQEEIEQVREYIANQKLIKETEKPILCTHAKMLNVENPNVKKIVIDEDPIINGIVLKVVTISKEQVETALSYAEENNLLVLIEALKKVLSKLEESESNLSKPIQFEKIDIKNTQLSAFIETFGKKLDFNLRDLLRTNVVITAKEKNKNITRAIIKNDLPDKPIIILSATIEPDILRKLYPERKVIVEEIKSPKNTGRIIHHHRSCSRSFFHKLNKSGEINEFLKEIKEKTSGIKNIISFKGMKSVLEENDFNVIAHYGATTGLDEFKGEPLIVLGTPYQNPNVVKLYAKVMGYDCSSSSPGTVNENVTKNGFEFSISLPEGISEFEKKLQLYLIETEIAQAAGRSRYLRENTEVHVFSVFPLLQSELIEDVS